MSFVCVPDLTQGEETIDKKNLAVENNNANLEEKAEKIVEIHVFVLNFVKNYYLSMWMFQRILGPNQDADWNSSNKVCREV